MPGILYLVASPIGNLEDITFRAIRVLKEVDLIACEDTRHTQKLLNHYGIKNKTISYHEHNERERAAQLLKMIQEGSSVAIVSDAGTPGISDPGFRLVQLASSNGVRVISIPGPTAAISALVASGIPADEFFFAGFLPARSSARRSRLAQLVNVSSTLVFYEAPHRLVQSLNDMKEMLGEREAVVARELTKLHEELQRGKLSELAARFNSGSEARGEFVIIVDRNRLEVRSSENAPAESLDSLVKRLEAEGLDSRTALKQAARALGLSRAEAYRRLVLERKG